MLAGDNGKEQKTKARENGEKGPRRSQSNWNKMRGATIEAVLYKSAFLKKTGESKSRLNVIFKQL